MIFQKRVSAQVASEEGIVEYAPFLLLGALFVFTLIYLVTGQLSGFLNALSATG